MISNEVVVDYDNNDHDGEVDDGEKMTAALKKRLEIEAVLMMKATTNNKNNNSNYDGDGIGRMVTT